jgi:HD domain/GAF domain
MKNRRAPIFVATVIALGFAELAAALIIWNFEHPPRLAIYLAVALVAALMKIRMPGMTGMLSAQFVIVLVVLIELPLAEALFIGGAAMLLQTVWDARTRPPVVRTFFNVAGVLISITVATDVYHHILPFNDQIGMAGVFALTYMAYFIMSTLPASIAAALKDQEALVAIWRESYVWSFPVFMLGAVIAALYVSSPARTRVQVCVVFVPLFYLVYRAYRVYLVRLASEKTNAEQTAALHLRTIEALALAIDAKDASASEDLVRVQTFAVALGRELGLDETMLKALQAAALLRDVGKLAIPQHILVKDRLTAEELERVKTHPIVGAEILEWVQFPYPVAEIVRAHHEKWDGSGYPAGLAGDQIPLAARILAAVDYLNALVSDRHYRSGIPIAKAMERIAAESGKSFDPALVNLLRARGEALEREVQVRRGVKRPISASLRQEYAAPQSAEANPPAPSSVENPIESISAARKETQLTMAGVARPCTLKEYLAMFALRIRDLIPHDAIAVYIRRRDRLVPEFAARDDTKLLAALELAVGEGLSGLVAETGKASLSSVSASEQARLSSIVQQPLRSALSVPIEAADGTSGVLTLYSTRKDGFTRDHLRILLSLRFKVLNINLGDPSESGRDAPAPQEKDYEAGAVESALLRG